MAGNEGRSDIERDATRHLPRRTWADVAYPRCFFSAAGRRGTIRGLPSDTRRLALDSSTPPDAPESLALVRAPGHRGRETSSFVGSLLDLPRLGGQDRRVAFRQVIAELARAASDEGPSPLEGIRSEALVKAVGAALEAGLADDLDWLDPGAAGAALYELAAALPVGPAQREVGRRVLARLLAGSATTFALIATRMARAGGKGLSSANVVARVALTVELPIAQEVPDAALSFAIASRRNLAREFVSGPSTRSLPERRLAARLLERAARDAVRRAQAGDRSAARIIGPEGPLEAVWTRLLGDREPLVWRHVAIARGLLAPFVEDGLVAIERDFAKRLSPTEWRRAAAAVGGVSAVKPELGAKMAARAFRDGLLERDPGAVTPFIWGLSRTAEAEPEAAREMLELTQAGAPLDVAEATLGLARELGQHPFAALAREKAHARMKGVQEGPSSDDGAAALRAELMADLAVSRADPPLSHQIDDAVAAFASDGARVAHERALELLEAARGATDALFAIGDDDDASLGPAASVLRRTELKVVRDLDQSLLERDAFKNLLRLDNREGRSKNAEEAVEHLRDRIFVWLVERELSAPSAPREAGVPHLTLHFARLRSLLHLVDGEALGRGEDAEGAALGRFRDAARELRTCFERSPPRELRRALMATFARCTDALARAGACDVADVLLVSGAVFHEVSDLGTLSEASMDPDTRVLLSLLSKVVAREAPKPQETPVGDSLFPPAAKAGSTPREAGMDALDRFADELARVGTARSDGLRTVASKLATALRAGVAAPSLRVLAGAGHEGDVAIAIENACFGLAQLFAGATTRILEESDEDAPRAPSRGLSTLLSQLLSSDEAADAAQREAAVSSLTRGLPTCFQSLVGEVIEGALALPKDAISLPPGRREPAAAAELPPWVPPRRVLGAFFLERPLAAGGVGSVFVVTRIEDRHDPQAERFALKVPDYNANAARHLSEAEFLALFRAEASTLVGLAPHDNLARFVTFDLAARPKPILVMELVEGPNLERLIDTRMFDMQRAVSAIVEVGAGLSSMHQAGLGHLDLKPANVVLRGGTTAVLVDFGLAGRTIRPGCGSAPYSPPEVWGYALEGSSATPMAADVYAFACLVFETLTGRLLFEGDTEVAMISQHVAHDGLPPGLRLLAQNRRMVPMAELLFSALRRDPMARIAMPELVAELGRLGQRVADIEWPVPLG